jgi:hypothetical protein
MARPDAPYFISFVDEAIFNPALGQYVGGRVEVYSDGEYADEEIRYFTQDPTFGAFRERYDFSLVSKAGLDRIRKTIERQYLERPL